MIDISNSDFDVNILEDALKLPNIELSFPLPTDKETYIELEANKKLTTNFKLINNFIWFISGGEVNFNEIYSDNEYRYSINKCSGNFRAKMKNYMMERLENTDEKLDELVYNLVDQELRLNLIKSSDFASRFKEVKKFMVNYYNRENDKNMPTFKSHNFIRICYITVINLFKKVFPKGIWCNMQQFSKLFQNYLKDPMSIIYLPNHQSHIDYIIIHLVSIRFHLSTPTVIAGDNLNVAIFGKILKGLGAIFIKRSFNDELYTERNLSNIIEFVLLNKIHLEVFIEGTRSRDGKVLLPKYGILKTLTNVYLKQVNENKNEKFDMLFLPLSITYERVYEADGYLHELLGRDKKQESFVNIIKNGVTDFFNKSEIHDPVNAQGKVLKNNGEYDNSTRTLHGKIFVRLGDSFKLSSFINDSSNLVKNDEVIGINEIDSSINLKKLGFKIMHDINRVSYLPEISIIGNAIQTFYYFTDRKEFHAIELLAILKILIQAFKEEEGYNNQHTNVKLLNNLLKFSDSELISLIKEQVPQFFRYIKINLLTNVITIEDSIELLYYKNLSIHLTIHKCLGCFILLALKQEDIKRFRNIHKLFYIFTGFLKNEFLFDYNYNKRNELSNILQDLIKKDKIRLINDNHSYEIVDEDYLKIFAEVVKPFIESYMICIENLNLTINKFYKETSSTQSSINENLLLKDNEISKYYPTTKILLKFIQKSKDKQRHIESINKQYLLSCLFYLDNLKLIKIFKNKARTKAFVIILNLKDLLFILKFLNCLFIDNQSFLKETNINYMIDIIDKNFERDANDKSLSKL